MLRLVDTPDERAYAVPFVVEREGAPHFRLRNIGREAVRAISLTLLGPGVMLAIGPNRLQPGEVMDFTLRGDDLARGTVVIVRWFRPSGDQYLWRVSF